MDQDGFQTQTTFDLFYTKVCCKGLWVSQNTLVLPYRALSKTLNLSDFSAFWPQHVSHHKNC